MRIPISFAWKLGLSYEGREIWMAVVTHAATGGDRSKPALWVDGNLHATDWHPPRAACA